MPGGPGAKHGRCSEWLQLHAAAECELQRARRANADTRTPWQTGQVDMVEKPTSGDEEQRRAQTRAARRQSGLPPESDDGGTPDAAGDNPLASGGSTPADGGDADQGKAAEPPGER
jgi:hypothetical protein